MFTQLLELLRKDLKVFVADRKALIISFAVPVAIACFMGMLTGNMGDSSNAAKPKSKIAVAVVDLDGGPVAREAIAKMQAGDSLDVRLESREAASKDVAEGKLAFAAVLPAGFSSASVAAMKSEGPSAAIDKMADPSKKTEAAIAEGLMSRVLASAVVKGTYGDVPGADAQHPPFEFREAPKAPAKEDSGKWSGIAHAFAGMAIQGLLFWSIESAMGILRERRMGLWRRMRAAPISPGMIMLGKVISGAVRALMIIAVVFGAGALVFHMRIQGSYVGFTLIALASSLMAATFGLFVAALGRTEQQSRGLSILAVLGMTMLGGAWFPSFLMPQWIQTISLAIPVRWAVDGFDAMLWRAQGVQQALPMVMALLGFALFFGVFALKRIRWEYEA